MSGEKVNIPLFILDFFILLPVTILRLALIYIYGSRYQIPGLSFFDVMMHADQPKFNGSTQDVMTETKSIKKVIRETFTEDELSTPVQTMAEQQTSLRRKGSIDSSTNYSTVGRTSDNPYRKLAKQYEKNSIEGKKTRNKNNSSKTRKTDTISTETIDALETQDLEKMIGMMISQSSDLSGKSKKSRDIFHKHNEVQETLSESTEESFGDVGEIAYGNINSTQHHRQSSSSKNGTSTARRINIMFTDGNVDTY